MADLYTNAVNAITAYNNKEVETLADACELHNAKIAIVNVMHGNEGIFEPDAFVTEEIQQTRENICKNCSHYDTGPVPRLCDVCECPVGLITTLFLKSCPEGKW